MFRKETKLLTTLNQTKMKLTHEMCNGQFEGLDIHTKRWLVTIMDQISYAEKKHPNWPKDIIHGAAIVGEESGELTQAALQYEYEKGQYYKIHKEAIQVAAMAIRLLKNTPEKKYPGQRKDKEPLFQPKFPKPRTVLTSEDLEHARKATEENANKSPFTYRDITSNTDLG